jgi:hypothetical protein
MFWLRVIPMLLLLRLLPIRVWVIVRMLLVT